LKHEQWIRRAELIVVVVVALLILIGYVVSR
jgi:hypothetical protein